MADPFTLSRFVQAQDQDQTYEQALAEIRAGRKQSHWMWFVFPQLAGLGRSATARFYALSSAAEATAYVQHEVLGPRLLEAAGAAAEPTGRTAAEVFGEVDALKLRSSVTLFRAVHGDPVFSAVLDRLFDGEPDGRTLELLAALR